MRRKLLLGCVDRIRSQADGHLAYHRYNIVVTILFKQMTQHSSALSQPKPGKQLRSERTLAAILDAAEILIAEKGYEAASINEIARMAGVTSGALYGRFDGKDGLLSGMFERHCARLQVSFDELCARINSGQLSMRAALEGAMQSMVVLYRDNGALVRAINRAASTSPTLRTEVMSFNRAVCAALYRALERYAPQISHPHPALAMKLGHEAGTRLLRSSILNEEIDYADLRALGYRIDDATLALEAARIWESYLISSIQEAD